MKKVIAFGALGAAFVVLVFASIAMAQSSLDQSNSAQNSPDHVHSPDSTGQATTDQNTVSVVIHHHAFDPEQQKVAPGTTVTWTNNDTDQHTVTADNGLFDSEVLNPGDSYSVWFDGKGIVTYHCKIHSYMQGSVVVGGDNGNGGTTTENPASTPIKTVGGTQNVTSGNATQTTPSGY